MTLNNSEIDDLKDFLEFKTDYYNRPSFIETDPVSIPHQFAKKKDIEISGFLTAILSWGQRKSIIKKASSLMNLMDDSPYDFIMNCSDNDFNKGKCFVYRTFNGIDCAAFFRALQNIYKEHGGLEEVFNKGFLPGKSIYEAIIHFRKTFFEVSHPHRSRKHISNPAKGSAAKRLNLFLRWMVRKDKSNIDFGLWEKIPASHLHIPLDIHVGNVARKLKLVKRKQNDWKAVEELTTTLKLMDPDDPVKYDYGLFGLGIYEKL